MKVAQSKVKRSKAITSNLNTSAQWALSSRQVTTMDFEWKRLFFDIVASCCSRRFTEKKRTNATISTANINHTWFLLMLFQRIHNLYWCILWKLLFSYDIYPLKFKCRGFNFQSQRHSINYGFQYAYRYYTLFIQSFTANSHMVCFSS